MKAVFKIRSKLAANTDADPKDVILVKEALSNLGHYQIPDYGLMPFPDKRLFDGIRKFQELSKLQVTEEINPGDETENELAGRSPILHCIKCGAPHGGAYGSLCYFCYLKVGKSDDNNSEA